MRLDKYLADMGAGTRSELKKEIRKGGVSVDGVIVKDPGFSVDASSRVVFRGNVVAYEEAVYYMLNKPAGIISASDDRRESTVVDLITEPTRKDLFPAGRLDRDTEGLLLITNDGALAHRLLSPKHHVDKVYYVQVSGALTEADVEAFRKGLVLPDGLECLPAELKIISVAEIQGDSESKVEADSDSDAGAQARSEFEAGAGSESEAVTDADAGTQGRSEFRAGAGSESEAVTDADAGTQGRSEFRAGARNEAEADADAGTQGRFEFGAGAGNGVAIVSEAEITIREGKFHQVKRMFSSVGKEVLYLKRLSMGPLVLDPELEPGAYRRLTEEELQALGV